MRLLGPALASVVSVYVLAQENAPKPAAELPKDIDLAEHYILLSAKVKNLSEVQDLILQQQQLVLSNLEALRKQVQKLEQERTNLLSRKDLDVVIVEFEHWKKQAAFNQESNWISLNKAIQELSAKVSASKPVAQTNSPLALRFESYRVQPLDTLSKIVAHWNEVLERQGLPRVTQDQVERANPGLSPDRIRVGQVLTIPILESAR